MSGAVLWDSGSRSRPEEEIGDILKEVSRYLVVLK